MNERRGKGQKTAKKAHLDWLPPYWQVATYTRLAVNPRGPLFVHRAYQAMGTLKWRLEGNKQRKWAKTVGREHTRLTTQGLRVSKWSFKLDSFHSLIKTCYYSCIIIMWVAQNNFSNYTDVITQGVYTMEECQILGKCFSVGEELCCLDDVKMRM